MTVGVDTSVIVAAVHANHPVHLPSARWLDTAFDVHAVVVAHHSILEAYAVLTRLPAQYRVSPSEAEIVLRETLEKNARVDTAILEHSKDTSTHHAQSARLAKGARADPRGRGLGSG